MNLREAKWVKSSLSAREDCVEVAFLDSTVAVRQSKAPAGPVLVFSEPEWRAFIGGVLNGELALPD